MEYRHFAYFNDDGTLYSMSALHTPRADELSQANRNGRICVEVSAEVYKKMEGCPQAWTLDSIVGEVTHRQVELF